MAYVLVVVGLLSVVELLVPTGLVSRLFLWMGRKLKRTVLRLITTHALSCAFWIAIFSYFNIGRGLSSAIIGGLVVFGPPQVLWFLFDLARGRTRATANPLPLLMWSALNLVWLVFGAWFAFSILNVRRDWEHTPVFSSVATVVFFSYVLAAPWALVHQWIQQQDRNAKAENTYARLRDGKKMFYKRPLIFYLRSFDWDEKFGNEKIKQKLFPPIIYWLIVNPLILLFITWRRLYARLGGRLESILYRATSQSFGAIVGASLGRPRGSRGFGRVRTTDAEWQNTAGTLLANADLILMMFSDTTGTSWELEQVVSRGLLGHVVFIVPPAYALRANADLQKYQLERDYRVFQQRMSAMGYSAPSYHQAMAFRLDPNADDANWTLFDEDFDKGKSTQLRRWLKLQIPELSADSAFATKITSSRSRAIITGVLRVAAATALGWQIEVVSSELEAAQLARDAQVRTQCFNAGDHLAPNPVITACSTMLLSYPTADDRTIAYNNRGLAYFALGDQARAVADFTEVIRLNPSLAMAYYNRGRAYQASRDYAGAISDLTQVLAIGADTPTLRDAHIVRGWAHAAQGDYRSAQLDYNAATDQDPQSALAFYFKGSADFILGENGPALVDISEAIELNPQYADAFLMRGFIYVARGDDVGAIADFGKAISVDPHNARALYSRGQARIRLRQFTEGHADIAAAIAIDPNVGSQDAPQ